MKKDIKIVLIGQPNSGKTSFCNQYCNKSFFAKETSGFEFFQKVNDDKYLNIYDCSGTINWLKLYELYFKDADVCVLFFDINDEDPIKSLEYWKTLFLTNKPIEFNIPFIVVGNKIDLQESSRKVSKETIITWCNSNENLQYFEVSSKENINIDKTFNAIINSATEFNQLKNKV